MDGVKILSSYKKSITLIAALLILFCKLQAQTADLNCEDIFNKMFTATKDVKTLRATITSVERIDGHLNHKHFAVKLNTSPYKVYNKDLDKGVEVLYLEGQNNNDAIVNPNGFPYTNLHLDPSGKIMRKEQHQTIKRSGFTYISDVLYHFFVKYPDACTHYVKQDADTVWDDNSCYKIEINFSPYADTPYVVKSDKETVSQLAAQYYLSDYQILTLNNISWYDDKLKAGQQILLPNTYAKTIILFVRKDDYLPVVIRIYDDKGFFEEYSYSNIQLNTTIPDAEFTEHYPGYHF